MNDRVINPDLYERAKKVGDPEGIKISMPNMKASYTKKLEDGKVVGYIERGQTGEKYVVCCPFCSDTRHRLTISYLYCSTVREEDGTKIHFGPIARCFNEECLQSPENAKRLNKILTGSHIDAAFHGFNVSASDGESSPSKAKLPNELVKFSELGSNHPASKYLEGRGFSLGEVDRRGVRYCESFPEWPIGEDRIFFPCHHMNTFEVIGGQMRDYNYSESNIAPKDLTLPGTSISQGAFGFTEDLTKEDYVIVAEAPLDAIAADSNAIASFGGTVNSWHTSRLIENFKFIIFMPDGDVRLDAEDDGKADIARRIRTQMDNIKRIGTSKCLWVRLPKDKDPADLGRYGVTEYIGKVAKKENMLGALLEVLS